MPSVVEILTLSTLVVIAVELVLLRKEVGRRQAGPRVDREPAEAQVINVNLGTTPQQGLAGTSPAMPLSVERLREPGTIGARESSGGEVEESAVGEAVEPPRRAAPAPRPTGSGLVAIPCPKCKAENSSYRTECFNCGASLH